ncbi:hypothetical protein PG991_013209 [Apiospora marii]|uniref:Amino acid transporter n=1 Tax=Apiospora marii TaxID=335849 RepID=A0ABR1R5D1_9PEZI
MSSDSEAKPKAHVDGPTVVRPRLRDDEVLARLGKKAVLKRNFGFLTILGFSCTVLVTWEGSLVGGPSGLVYNFLVVWVGTLSVFAVLSELVSMAPTSGGQYHWISMLAPASWRKFFGYITGWLCIVGWQAVAASSALLSASMIQGIILLCHPDYANTMQGWHGLLISWALVLFSFAVNAVIGSILAKFEGLVLILHLLGFFAIMLPLVLLGEHVSPADVFNNFVNNGGWPTQALSSSIGMTGSVLAFLGGDAAMHMAEEIRGAPLVIPRSLFSGLILNGCLGFGMVVACMFSLGDLDEALAENPNFPYMAIFHRAVGSRSGAAAMASIVVVLCCSATTGAMASASRILWAFSRDRGTPGKVARRTGIPFNSVLLTAFISMLLSLINLGNATAFNGITTIQISGLCGSYLFVATLLLYNRLAGHIQEPYDDNAITNTMGKDLTWGPWRLRGYLGTANNAFACVYLIYVWFFAFWPASVQVTPPNFNWAVLPFTVITLFSLLYYALWARKTYAGPIIEF